MVCGDEADFARVLSNSAALRLEEAASTGEADMGERED